MLTHPGNVCPLQASHTKPTDREVRGTPEEAQTKYIALIEKLKEEYGFDADKVPEAVGA
jgi:hypothetical protein